MTYAVAFDQENIHLYDGVVNKSKNKTLTIQNIESYYNYRTIENDFKLVSSVLSNENNFIELRIKNIGSVQNRIYEMTPEVNLTQNDIASNYSN